jgi:hypothetical protein
MTPRRSRDKECHKKRSSRRKNEHAGILFIGSSTETTANAPVYSHCPDSSTDSSECPCDYLHDPERISDPPGTTI